jgi:hypothetical protein
MCAADVMLLFVWSAFIAVAHLAGSDREFFPALEFVLFSRREKVFLVGACLNNAHFF